MNMENKKVVRNNTHEVRASEEDRIIEGYAALYETPSDGLPFEEIIARGAFDGVIERSVTLALLDHRQSRGVLAKNKNGKGTLSLVDDKVGLFYQFRSPSTELGNETIEGITRGDIDGSSFAFDVEEDKWEKKSDGTWKRTILKIGQLYDVSPVYNAAYSQTSVYVRSKEQAEELLQEQEAKLQKEQEERAKTNLPDSYYENLHKSLIL